MLKKLFGKNKNKAEDKNRKTISFGLKTTIYNVIGMRSIPSMPNAAQQAFKLSTNPNADARDFIEVIESDESLSARLMKIANSVFFDRGTGSKTIEEAVHVIGIQELRCLLNACSLTEIFPSRHSARQQLWANDVATAIISRALAARLVPGKEDFAFLAGLMHDIGKLLLLQQAEIKYSLVLSKVEQGQSFQEAEEDVFAFNHMEAGTLVGEKWRFDEDLLEVIQTHHDPIDPNMNKDQLTVAQVIQLADLIAHTQGFGHPKGFNKFQKQSEEKLLEIWHVTGLTKEDLKEFSTRIKESLENEYDLYSGQQKNKAH
ncbi:MAG: HDOD domain-containing protein [Bdellovibrionota bacterium]